MVDRAYIIRKTLENKIAIAENDYQYSLLVSLDVLKEIIAVLKEQEAVEPVLRREGRNKNYNDYVCPRCDNEVVYEQNYCSECGVKFMWEGR